MTSNYEKAQKAIKAKHGGELPSDLYLQTNAQLSQMLYDLTGDIKHICRPAAKEALVKRVLKLTNQAPLSKATGQKRKLDSDAPDEARLVKVPKNCLEALSQTQIAQMKRIMALTDDQIQGLQHEKDLRPLWSSVGMTAVYPNMTGKVKVVEKLKHFAEKNLKFHGLL